MSIKGRDHDTVGCADAVAGQANNAGNDNAQCDFGLDRGRPHAGACAWSGVRAEQSTARRGVGRRNPKDRGGRRIERDSDPAQKHAEQAQSASDRRTRTPRPRDPGPMIAPGANFSPA